MVYGIRGERGSYPKAVACGRIERVKREDHCGSPQATAATDSSRQIPPSSTNLSAVLSVYFPFSSHIEPDYLLHTYYLPIWHYTSTIFVHFDSPPEIYTARENQST